MFCARRKDAYKIVQQFILLQVFIKFLQNPKMKEVKIKVARNELLKTCKIQIFKIQRLLNLFFEWAKNHANSHFFPKCKVMTSCVPATFTWNYDVFVFLFQRKLCPYNSIWCHNNRLLLTSSIIIIFGRIKRLVKIHET